MHITRCVLGAVALGMKVVAPMLMSLGDRDIPELIDTCVQCTSVEVPPAQGMIGDSSWNPAVDTRAALPDMLMSRQPN